ncbi:hypothetical protein [Granulicoccus phenolivorans]|uniref:hypothetical protein n=1 Tax=Granulicoccus phenolivorans TaxID=266854 RepID=UPI00047B0AD8|nr:hypothetical protein [Granulicoccus phenolivorans]
MSNQELSGDKVKTRSLDLFSAILTVISLLCLLFWVAVLAQQVGSPITSGFAYFLTGAMLLLFGFLTVSCATMAYARLTLDENGVTRKGIRGWSVPWEDVLAMRVIGADGKRPALHLNRLLQRKLSGPDQTMPTRIGRDDVARVQAFLTQHRIPAEVGEPLHESTPH